MLSRDVFKGVAGLHTDGDIIHHHIRDHIAHIRSEYKGLAVAFIHKHIPGGDAAAVSRTRCDGVLSHYRNQFKGHLNGRIGCDIRKGVCAQPAFRDIVHLHIQHPIPGSWRHRECLAFARFHLDKA